MGGARHGPMSSTSSGPNKAVRERLAKLNLTRPFDLILHLPLRYEDETHLTPICAARHGAPVQVEGTVVHADIKYRPRRQLVAQIEDAGGVLVVRFLNFYPSQVKQFQPGVRLRLLGEVHEGFFGAEMVHPRYRVVAEGSPRINASEVSDMR